MRIQSEDGWVELATREDEEAFEVRAAVGDFAGHNPKIWIRSEELKRFLDDLTRMARLRQGEAHMKAMSAEEFELTIRMKDGAPLGVEGLVGRLWYSGQRPHRLVLRFSFSLDPAGLPAIVREAVKLSARPRRPTTP